MVAPLSRVRISAADTFLNPCFTGVLKTLNDSHSTIAAAKTIVEQSRRRAAAAEGAESLVVLQVVPAMETGGVERGAVDIAGAIVEAGGTALVASEGGSMVNDLKRVGAEHIQLPMASKNPLTMWRNTRRLSELIRSRKVDILHVRSRAPAWSARKAAAETGCHFVTTFHAPYNQSNAVKRGYNAVMASGERVIAISHFIAAHIRSVYKVDSGRIRVIHRGVDLRRFDPDLVSAERVIKQANAWRLPDGVPLIMLPGRLTRWKGQTLLLEALTQLGDLDLVCALVGSDQGRSDYRDELERQIKESGLEGRAFILDHCDDMPAAYKLSDVVVSASSDPEGFGRVVGEAQAMGRPVVASNHGGAREQVIEDRTAFLFPPGDARGLAEALRRALALSETEREVIGREAIAHVRENFSKEKMCAQTLSLYRELLRADAYEKQYEADSF